MGGRVRKRRSSAAADDHPADQHHLAVVDDTRHGYDLEHQHVRRPRCLHHHDDDHDHPGNHHHHHHDHDHNDDTFGTASAARAAQPQPMTSGEESLTARAQHWLAVAAIFVAPTTLISGLCYFLGFVATRHRLLYFGVEPGALGFSTTDYVVKAVAVYNVPVFEVLLVCVVLLGAAVGIRSLAGARRHTRLLRATAWTLLAAAALSIGVATASLKFNVVREVPRSLPMTLASLAVGILLLLAGQRLTTAAATNRFPLRKFPTRAAVSTSLTLGTLGALNAGMWHVLRRRFGPDGSPVMTWTLFLVGGGLLVAGYWILLITRPAAHRERPRALAAAEPFGLALAVAMMVVALFSLTNQYAIASGDRDGADTQKGLWGADIGVTLETKDKLGLPSDVVKVTPVVSDNPAVGVTYRYECLRSVEIRANRWVLVPAKWTRDAGYAVIVTPDASNRITTTVHSSRSAQTGGGDNVQRYWQCPEVVPTFDGSDLTGKLLTVQEVQRVVGAGQFEPEVSTSAVLNMLSATRPGPPPQCVAVADDKATSSLVPDYRDQTAAQEQSMVSGADGLHVWVDEGVTTFPTPSKAFDFVAHAKEVWRHCADAVVGVARHGAIEARRVGKLHPNGTFGIPWVRDGPPDTAGITDCSQAIAAKSNIVIDVDVCGSDPSAAMQIAKAIRDKIPTDKIPT